MVLIQLGEPCNGIKVLGLFAYDVTTPILVDTILETSIQ